MSRHFLTFILFMSAFLCENGIAQVEQVSLPSQGGLQERQVKCAFEIGTLSASASVLERATPPFFANAPGLEQAIERPPVPERVVDSLFLYVNVGYALAAAYDGATTQWFLHNTRAHEVNPLFGSHPSTARLWGEGSALTAAVIFGSYELKSTIRDSGGCTGHGHCRAYLCRKPQSRAR